MNLHNSCMRFVLNIYHFTDLVSFRNSYSSFHLCSFQSLWKELIIIMSPVKGMYQISLLIRENSMLYEVTFQNQSNNSVAFLVIWLQISNILCHLLCFVCFEEKQKFTCMPECSRCSVNIHWNYFIVTFWISFFE